MLTEVRSKKGAVVAVLIVIAFAVFWLLIPSGVVSDASRLSSGVLTTVPDTYRPETVSFSVRVNDLAVPYRVFGIFLMPGETVRFKATFESDGRSALARAAAGRIEEVGEAQWTWTAPDLTGWYPITFSDQLVGEVVRLNAFVMEPYDPTSESVDTSHVGRYPARARRNNPVYERPKGFIQVTEENKDVLVSPHFTIGQFAAGGTAGYPKYLALQERLLVKLEAVLRKMNESGIHVNTFHVMSGYRAPIYSALIGNETEYSLHPYGAAADIFVDMDEDGYMDDLNGDGEATVEDAWILAELVESLREDSTYDALTGGLGIYGPATHRGPFVHVDVRGQAARW